MTGQSRHLQMDAARLHADLSIHDLWVLYIGLGGTCGAFDVDGYLHGVLTLDRLQQQVLAQAVNEALMDLYDAYAIPCTAPTIGDIDTSDTSDPG